MIPIDVEKVCTEIDRFKGYLDEDMICRLKIAVKRLPTVDAVPVVRCKDCKHNQLPPTSGNAICDLWYGMTDLFGYCSSGERRDEDETEL